ncbi:MAG: PAS domain S-box protein [Candidatus Marinimicrobia bacterium]|nr:PAS domain S-box protein [Candidatus Neomarinimicrobiota bacterium]
MSDRKRFLYLMLIMTTVALLVMGITDYILYQAAYKEEQERLVETVQSQARLMEAVARFNAIYSNDYPDGSYLATVSQIIDAHKNYKGFGETGEFTLARLVGDSIVFLLSHRHYELEKPRSIPIGTELAEPMRLALSGKSGTITGLDYRGENVLAAYEPVAMLHLGLVAKIDLSEIRAPFIRASLIAFMSAFMIILIGSLLFLRISNPVLRRLQEYAERLEKMVAKRTKKFQESENRFRTSVENMLDCFGIYSAIRDESGRIVDFRVDYVNEAACVSNRMTREEQIGKGMCELLPAHRETGLFDEYCEVVKTGSPFSKEELVYEDVYGDQRLVRAFDIRISRLGDGFAAAWRDITERKRVEEELRQYERIVSTSTDMLALINKKFIFLAANKTYVEAFNKTPDEVIGHTVAEVLGEKFFNTTVKPNAKRCLAGKEVNYQVWFEFPVYGRRYMDVTFYPYYNEDNKIIGFLINGRNITERKKAEEDFENIFNISQDMVGVFTIEGKLVKVNPSWEKVLGYKIEELLNMGWAKLVHPDDVERTNREVEKQLIGSSIANFVNRYKCKDGSYKTLEWQATFAKNGIVHATARDITERKRTEEELNRKHNLIESIKNVQSQFIADADPYILFDNILKYTLSLTQSEYGIMGEVLYTDEGDPYLKIHTITNIARNKETKEFYKKNAPIGMEFRNLNTLLGAVMTTGKPVISNDPSTDPRSGGLPEGHPALNTFLGVPIYHGDELVGMAGMANRSGGYDEEVVEYIKPLFITYANIIQAYRNDQLRKKAEDAVRESEEKYRTLIETSPEAVTMTDLEGNLSFVSQRTLEIHGYKKKEELLGKSAFELIAPEDHEKATINLKKTLEKGLIRDQEFTLLKKDGARFKGELSCSLINDVSENPISFIATTRDITERKRAEEKIARFARIFEESLNEIYLFKADTLKFTQVNRAAQHNLGYTLEEIQKLTPLDLKPKFTPDSFAKLVGPLRKGEKKKIVFETVHKRKDQSIYDVEVHLQLMKHEREALFTAIILDVTERKGAEEALREAEQKFRQFFENEPAYCYMVSPEGTILDVNRAATEILGYEKEELVGRPLKDIYVPESLRKMEENIEKWQKTGKLKDVEMVIQGKGGEKRVILLNSGAVKDKDGNIIHSVSAQSDITERKQAEEKLRETHEKLKTSIDNMPNAYILCDTETIVLEWNLAAEKIFGYSKEEMLGKNLIDFIVPEKGRHLVGEIVKKLKVGIVADYSDKDNNIRKDGKLISCQWFNTPLADKNGKVFGILFMAQDVTERKRVEEALQESEESYRGLYDHAIDAIYIQDREGRFLDVNQGAVDMYGYPKEFFIGKTPEPLAAPGKNDLKQIAKYIERAFKGEPQQFEFWGKRKNGEVFPKIVRLNKSQYFGKEAIIAFALDITERKQAEEEVYQSREQLRALTARLQSIREEEQTRISRELHDELGHLLTALKIDLVALSKDPLIKSKPQADDLQSMISLTDHSLQTVKRIATELRPGVLDHLGIGAAIEWQSKEFQSHTQIKCEVRLPEERIGLNKDKDIILFRILQESLTNVARHAQATNIVITLKMEKQSISMIVQDDGRGIEESEVVGMRSLGLLGMQERAHLVGGKLTITGEQGKGTTISVSVPID